VARFHCFFGLEFSRIVPVVIDDLFLCNLDAFLVIIGVEIQVLYFDQRISHIGIPMAVEISCDLFV